MAESKSEDEGEDIPDECSKQHFSVPGGPLADDSLGVDGADKAFEEVVGDLPIVKGIVLELGTFEMVTWSTRPLGSHRQEGKRGDPSLGRCQSTHP